MTRAPAGRSARSAGGLSPPVRGVPSALARRLRRGARRVAARDHGPAPLRHPAPLPVRASARPPVHATGVTLGCMRRRMPSGRVNRPYSSLPAKRPRWVRRSWGCSRHSCWKEPRHKRRPYIGPASRTPRAIAFESRSGPWRRSPRPASKPGSRRGRSVQAGDTGSPRRARRRELRSARPGIRSPAARMSGPRPSVARPDRRLDPMRLPSWHHPNRCPRYHPPRRRPIRPLRRRRPLPLPRPRSLLRLLLAGRVHRIARPHDLRCRLRCRLRRLVSWPNRSLRRRRWPILSGTPGAIVSCPRLKQLRDHAYPPESRPDAPRQPQKTDIGPKSFTKVCPLILAPAPRPPDW